MSSYQPNTQFITSTFIRCQSQWPRGLRRRSTASRLLRLWVPILPGTWTFFCCECCVLSGRGLWGELITRPEESYRLWCVVVWSRNLVNEEALAHRGGWAFAPKRNKYSLDEFLLHVSVLTYRHRGQQYARFLKIQMSYEAVVSGFYLL